MANNNFDQQTFRLAAVLYVDNNYEVSTKTIHKKIIESVFLENQNKPLNIHEIIDFIEKQNCIVLDPLEVQNVLTGGNDSAFNLGRNSSGDITACLTAKRKLTIDNKINNKTIVHFIDAYINANPEFSNKYDIKEIILFFLYNLFNSNVNDFIRFTQSKPREGIEFISLKSASYAEDHIRIINGFLNWDNDDKNKAIFDIASYALEYSMLTNINSNTNLQLNKLKNKIFYIDTNVIYRGLGINGENRKARTRTFLNKFKEAQEKILISRFTEEEFKESIKYQIDKLSKHLARKVNPNIFANLNTLSDIFPFFHRWRLDKVNSNLNLFEAYILGLYEDFKKEFSIQVEYKIPFTPQERKSIPKIIEYANEIAYFKSKEGLTSNSESDFYDATNIYLLELRRGTNNSNIFETQYFFISTDQSLRRWDFQRYETPIVILPSQWLSILLRYVNRTNDDYKSFVSFLNLRYSQTLIESEKLNTILSGISEITEDFEQQNHLVSILVDRKFKGIIDNSSDDNDIYEKAKLFAETELEKTIKELEGKHFKLAESLESHRASTKGEIEKLQAQNIESVKAKNQRVQENIALKEKNTTLEIELARTSLALKNKYLDEKITIWKRPAYYLAGIGFVILIFEYLVIFNNGWEYNYPYQLIKWIESFTNSTQKFILQSLIYTPFLGLYLISRFCFKRLFSSEEKEKKRSEFEKSYKA